MWILIPLLLLAGCIQSNPEPEAAKTAVPTAVPTLAPVAIRIAVDETEPPMTAIPTPTASPTPEPTATPSPEPTATPNPYRAETVTAHKESEDFWYCELTEATKERIIGSTFPENPKDCPVKITDLRYVSLLYVDFEGETHTGELIVNRKVADDVIDIFYALYRAAYPLTSVKLLDDFGEKFDAILILAVGLCVWASCRNARKVSMSPPTSVLINAELTKEFWASSSLIANLAPISGLRLAVCPLAVSNLCTTSASCGSVAA